MLKKMMLSPLTLTGLSTLIVILVVALTSSRQNEKIESLQAEVAAFLTAEVTTPTPRPITPTAAPSPLSGLREEHRVRELDPFENDLPITQLPNGVYGYTVPWILNTDPTGVVGGTGVSRINLNRSSFGTLVMEVHKTSDGTIYIVGFVTPDIETQLAESPEGTELEFTLLFAAHEDYNRPVAIPVESILYSDNRHIDLGRDFIYANDLRVIVP